MKRSKISYTDFSGGHLNFVTGCTKVSEGCRFCYAEAIYTRFGRDFSQVRTHPEKLERLRKAKFPAENNRRGPHARPMCFVCDTGDLFHGYVPGEFIREAFTVMGRRQDVDWLVLTKRPEYMAEVLFGSGGQGNCYLDGGDYYGNIWLGVTVENRVQADIRIPLLLDSWAGKTWVSVEPMLEGFSLAEWLKPYGMRNLDWVVVGAESGPNRRPFEVGWALKLKEECDWAGIAYFGKQDSGLYPGKPLLIDGKEWKVWPR